MFLGGYYLKMLSLDIENKPYNKKSLLVKHLFKACSFVLLVIILILLKTS